MLILNESEIRACVDADAARAAVEGAFRALHRGEATLAGVISLPFSAPEGAAHIKAGSADFDPGDGAPMRHSGLMTGAAGAVAADVLARHDVTTTAIVGAGSQAR
jgi:ornithine cyclodeaminase/alanine dehydrogenase-like protein (mu-crystallin family)